MSYKVGDIVTYVSDGTTGILLETVSNNYWRVNAGGTIERWSEYNFAKIKSDVSQAPVQVPGKFETLAIEIGKLTDEKNLAYGNSAATAGQVLKLYYPNGVQPEQYNDMLLMVRILDKLSRVATRKDAFGESPFRDIAGYGLIGASQDSEKK